MWWIPIGLTTWAAGIVVWRSSVLLGILITVLGGLAVSWTLTVITRTARGRLIILGVTIPMATALVLLSFAVSSESFEVRVATLTLGLLCILIVFVFVVTERTRAEVESARIASYEQQRRLAADIHDVVGHTLSASMLHTTAARLAIPSNPDKAIASLEQAERHGRRSLDDIRTLVRILRVDDPRPSNPIHGVEHIGALVADLRQAGAQITFREPSEIPELPAASAITVYRVVQEGLTNAVRHGRGPINLTLEYDDDSVAVELVNLVDPSHSRSSGGTGLGGMHDRVGSIGGSLQWRLDDDASRWVLRARIPR